MSQHVDKTRKPGDYCKAKCALCYVAAVQQLSARGDESRLILNLKAGESLEIRGRQSELLVALIEATEADLASVAKR